METQLVQYVSNLGYFMDCNKLCSQWYLMLWKIQHMRSYFDQDTVKIVQALIMSKLDYCNSLLIGFAKYQLEKTPENTEHGLQVVLNLMKFDHVSAHMKYLHWLRIRERICTKLPHLSFNAKMVKLLDT